MFVILTIVKYILFSTFTYLASEWYTAMRTTVGMEIGAILAGCFIELTKSQSLRVCLIPVSTMLL